MSLYRVLCIWVLQASGDSCVPESLVLATVTLIPTIRMAPQGNQNLRAWGRVLETQVYGREPQVPMLSECGTVSIAPLGHKTSCSPSLSTTAILTHHTQPLGQAGQHCLVTPHGVCTPHM